MKAIIFAGGVGTRLWPLSRKKTPKQLEKIIDNKSTLELAVERLLPEFKPSDIYISTGIDYIDKVAEQLPILPKENIIGEPVKRDNGPPVAVVTSYIAKMNPSEPVVILWSDHLVKHETVFKQIVLTSGEIMEKDPNKMIFIGQKPRFASDNLGWIETGAVKQIENNITFREFSAFKYRPDEETAREYFKKPNYCWNLGYFVTTAGFLENLFKVHAPEIHAVANKIAEGSTPKEFHKLLNAHYQEMPEINFDKAVLEFLDKDAAYVVIEDIGWSDIGAWEALKEALSGRHTDNVTKGNVQLEDSTDNLVYNFEGDKFIVGIDLDDMVVVNTKDVVLVGKKTSISKVKKIVESFAGTEKEKYT